MADDQQNVSLTGKIDIDNAAALAKLKATETQADKTAGALLGVAEAATTANAALSAPIARPRDAQGRFIAAAGASAAGSAPSTAAVQAVAAAAGAPVLSKADADKIIRENAVQAERIHRASIEKANALYARGGRRDAAGLQAALLAAHTDPKVSPSFAHQMELRGIRLTGAQDTLDLSRLAADRRRTEAEANKAIRESQRFDRSERMARQAEVRQIEREWNQITSRVPTSADEVSAIHGRAFALRDRYIELGGSGPGGGGPPIDPSGPARARQAMRSRRAAMWTNTGEALTRTGMAETMMFTAPIAAVDYFTQNASIKEEAGFSRVKRFGFKDQAEENFVRRGLRDLVLPDKGGIPISLKEAQQIAEEGNLQGITGRALVPYTDTVARISAITQMNSDAASTGAARVLSQSFNDQVPKNKRNIGADEKVVRDLKNFGSALVAVDAVAPGHAADILKMATNLSVYNGLLKMSTQDLLAWTGTMVAGGVKAEKGATNIGKILTNLAKLADKPGPVRGTLANMLQVLGLSPDEAGRGKLIGAMNNNPMAVLDKMIGRSLKYADQNPNHTLPGFFDEIGIKDQRELQVLGAGIANPNRGKIFQAVRQGWKDNTALDKQSNTLFGTRESQIKLLGNLLNDVGITAGGGFSEQSKQLIAATKSTIEFLGKLAKGFNDLSPGWKNFIFYAGLALAAMGPLSIAVGKGAGAIGTLLRVFATAQEAKGAKDFFQMLTNQSLGLGDGLGRIEKQAEEVEGGIAAVGKTGKTAGMGLAASFGVFALVLAGIVVDLGLAYKIYQDWQAAQDADKQRQNTEKQSMKIPVYAAQQAKRDHDLMYEYIQYQGQDRTLRSRGGFVSTLNTAGRWHDAEAFKRLMPPDDFDDSPKQTMARALKLLPQLKTNQLWAEQKLKEHVAAANKKVDAAKPKPTTAAGDGLADLLGWGNGSMAGMQFDTNTPSDDKKLAEDAVKGRINELKEKLTDINTAIAAEMKRLGRSGVIGNQGNLPGLLKRRYGMMGQIDAAEVDLVKASGMNAMGEQLSPHQIASLPGRQAAARRAAAGADTEELLALKQKQFENWRHGMDLSKEALTAQKSELESRLSLARTLEDQHKLRVAILGKDKEISDNEYKVEKQRVLLITDDKLRRKEWDALEARRTATKRGQGAAGTRETQDSILARLDADARISQSVGYLDGSDEERTNRELDTLKAQIGAHLSDLYGGSGKGTMSPDQYTVALNRQDALGRSLRASKGRRGLDNLAFARDTAASPREAYERLLTEQGARMGWINEFDENRNDPQYMARVMAEMGEEKRKASIPANLYDARQQIMGGSLTDARSSFAAALKASRGDAERADVYGQYGDMLGGAMSYNYLTHGQVDKAGLPLLLKQQAGLLDEAKSTGDTDLYAKVAQSMASGLGDIFAKEQHRIASLPESQRSGATLQLTSFFESIEEWKSLPAELKDAIALSVKEAAAEARREIPLNKAGIEAAEGIKGGVGGATERLGSDLIAGAFKGHGGQRHAAYKQFWDEILGTGTQSIAHVAWDGVMRPQISRLFEGIKGDLSSIYAQGNGALIRAVGAFGGLLAQMTGGGGKKRKKGAMFGTLAGAAIGSIVPGVGTMLGASIGGQFGGTLGGGGNVGDAFLAAGGAYVLGGGSIGAPKTGGGVTTSGGTSIGSTDVQTHAGNAFRSVPLVQVNQTINASDRSVADYAAQRTQTRVERAVNMGAPTP